MLPKELQETIVIAARYGASRLKKSYGNFYRSKKNHGQKNEVAHHRKIDATQEEYKMAMELWEQYHLPHCWKTGGMANDVYDWLKSETP